MKTRLSHLSAALLMGVFASGAQAAFQSCVNGPGDPGADYDIRTKVSSATDCTILLPLNVNDNDNPMPGFVNTKGFFGINNWLYDGKWDDLTGTGGTEKDGLDLFDFTGNNQSGSYSPNIGHSLGSVDRIMFVFKDGANTNLVGYLVGMTAGAYASPFVEPPFPLSPATGPKNISHISVYYTTTSSGGTTSGGSTTSGGAIPEPGVLGLLGLGLLGLALARRST